MANLTRGRTFASDEKLTPAKLNSLVDDGSITSIALTDMDSTLRSYFHSTADPGVTVPRLWFDCATDGTGGLKFGFCSPSNYSLCGWLVGAPYREAYYWASTRVSYGTPLFVGRNTTGQLESSVAMHKYDGLNLMKVYQAMGSTQASESQMPLVIATESVTAAGPIRCAWAGLVPAFTYASQVSVGNPLLIDHWQADRFKSIKHIPATILTNLVARWDMDSGSGATQLDTSGNDYHLAKANQACAEVTGKLDTTLQFTGSTNQKWHISTNGISDFDVDGGDYSWSFWAILGTVTPAGNNMELVNNNWGTLPNGRAYRFFFNKPDNTLGMTMWDSSASLAFVYAGGAPAVSTWYCVQAYKEGNQMGLRINGGAWTTASIHPNIFPYDNYFSIGLNAANQNPLTGAVDEILMWKGRRLTDTEFNALYSSGAAKKVDQITSTPELKRASIYGTVIGNADNSTPASNPTNFLLWGTGPALQDISG